MHETSAQVAIAILLNYAIQWAKKSNVVPWITETSPWITRTISLVVAMLTTAGFSYALEGNLTMGGKLIIAFPSLDSFIDFVSHGVEQFGFQEVYYQTVVKK